MIVISLARVQVAFELVCNVDLVTEWDMTFKSARYLQHSRDDAAGVEVGYLHIVYGLPGGLGCAMMAARMDDIHGATAAPLTACQRRTP